MIRTTVGIAIGFLAALVSGGAVLLIDRALHGTPSISAADPRVLMGAMGFSALACGLVTASFATSSPLRATCACALAVWAATAAVPLKGLPAWLLALALAYVGAIALLGGILSYKFTQRRPRARGDAAPV